MSVKLWNTAINGLFLWSTTINQAYLGSVEVFSVVTILIDKGWFGGWRTSTQKNEVDWLSDINTTTPTSQNPSATLSSARDTLTSVASNTTWFFMWGRTVSNPLTEIDWLEDTNTNSPTAINPSATLSLARRLLGSIYSATIWFAVWGLTTSSGNTDEVDWIENTNTTTPSTINPSATLAIVKRGNSWNIQSTTKGWSCGWYVNIPSAWVTNEISWLSSTDTTSPTSQNPSAVLVVARDNSAWISTTSIWFICGWNTTVTNFIDWLQNTDTNTPTSINPSATLAVARKYLSSCSSTDIGFCAGWTNSATSSNLNEVDWLSSTDTTSPTWINPSATLAVGRWSLAWIQNGTS